VVHHKRFLAILVHPRATSTLLHFSRRQRCRTTGMQKTGTVYNWGAQIRNRRYAATTVRQPDGRLIVSLFLFSHTSRTRLRINSTSNTINVSSDLSSTLPERKLPGRYTALRVFVENLILLFLF